MRYFIRCGTLFFSMALHLDYGLTLVARYFFFKKSTNLIKLQLHHLTALLDLGFGNNHRLCLMEALYIVFI